MSVCLVLRQTYLKNPEANGMIPHIIIINSAMEYMKGLDLNVFRGKRIAMVGDSTLRYPTEWLYPMIKKFDDEGVDDPKYENMTLSNASALVKERTAKFGVKTVGRKAPPPIKTLDGTVSLIASILTSFFFPTQY